MKMDKLVQKQLELQKDAVKRLEEKLDKKYQEESQRVKNRVEGKGYLGKTEFETSFQKIYLEKINKEINNIRDENLPTVIAKLIKNNKDFLINIKDNLNDFENWEDYERLKRVLKPKKDEENEKNMNIDVKEVIKDYLIEDLSKFLSQNLLKKIENKSIFYEKNNIYSNLYEFLLGFLEDINVTIDEYKLSQKQAFSLWTLPLNSTQISYASFISLTKLLIVKEKEDEDKINPSSKQQIIKDIGETLYVSIKNNIDNLKFDKPTNAHLFEMVSELFVFFEYFNVVSKVEKIKEDEESDRFDEYELSKEFVRDSKIILKTIQKYTPPFFEPMIVPPLEWKSVDDGGYLKGDDVSAKYNLLIQKTKTKMDRKRVLAQKESISKDFLKAINILQATKWKINKKVLRVVSKSIPEEIKEVKKRIKEKRKEYKYRFNQIDEEVEKLLNQKNSIDANYKGKIETIKEILTDKEEIKQKQKELKKKKKKELNDINTKIVKLLKEKKSILKDLKGKQNKLKVQEKILEIAQKYKDFENIYFTWQVDFRGRVYPVQALLNPQGEDLAKALLEFSEKKPLGEDGLFWLKVHGANCYGVDKVSFDDRLKWVDENEENIKRIVSLDKPYEDDFLQNADDKYRFLAFCYEYDEYLKNPNDFKSSIPVAIDGSNNGFQHIATLLRDIEGAKKVNVLPTDSDKPEDIYNEVAKELKGILERVTESDLIPNKLEEEITKEDREYAQKALEDIKLLLIGKKDGQSYIDRKFVKKGVMTDSYGAGTTTKADQIAEFIEDELKIEDKLQSNQSKFLFFIAKKLDKAIDRVAPSSQKYKSWINRVAKVISNQKKPITWHTPFIGFEVTQVEYKTREERIYTTNPKGEKSSIQIKSFLDEIDTKKQEQGLPPNFIHSLDATHLYLTILSSYENGVDAFATIHDSFATHACSVSILTKKLKEEFKKLAKYDVLDNFQKEIAKKYDLEIVDELSNDKDKKVKQIIDVKNLYIDKDFDIDLIDEAKYFFA